MRTPVSVLLVLVLPLATTGCLRWPDEPREEREERTTHIDPRMGADAVEGAGVSSLKQHVDVQDYDLAAPLEKLRRTKKPLAVWIDYQP